MNYRLGESQKPDKAHRAARRRRAARRTAAVLPTLFTLGNLLSGFISVFFASRLDTTELPFHWSPLTFSAIFIFVGMVMDGLDGRVARMTHNTSDLGAQLDSMADMVTFGVAPAFMAVQLVGINAPFIGIAEPTNDFAFFFERATLVVAAIYVSCTALRLARFNIELHKPVEADHSSFKGLPSPGAAGTVASLVLMHQHFVRANHNFNLIQYSAVAMVVVMLLVAFAMVSRLRYIHLANRYLRGRVGIRKLAIGVSILMGLAVWPQGSLAVGFTGFAVSAPAVWLWNWMMGKPNAAKPQALGASELTPPASREQERRPA